MANSRQHRNGIFSLNFGTTMALAIAFVLTVVASPAAQAQTFKVLHNFTGGGDGANPTAGVTMDGAENLYGTASKGGIGYGTVYRLKHSGGTFNPLFSFDASDGAYPLARVVFGPNGLLYGTASEGGAYSGGVIFKLQPSPTACKTALCSWNETVLYNFPGYPNGGNFPAYGDLLFDHAKNMYGTTYYGGSSNVGAVYEQTPPENWGTETVLYSFSGSDGADPLNGVIADGAGNLYSTTYVGGEGLGTVFQLTYMVGLGWTETLPTLFNGSDGSYPYAGLIFDSSGINLYGATSSGGTYGAGAVFELMPCGGTCWTYQPVYSFTGTAGCGPWGTLFMDASGNLYGTTYCDGLKGFGNVFELSPSNGSWMYTDLHDFTGGSDGGYPISNVIFDTAGNLYGTASVGGAEGFGVVWEITP